MLDLSIGWLQDQDLRLCLACNRAGPTTIAVLRAASRLGDGPLWILLVPVLAGTMGIGPAGRLLGALATAGALYRLTKQSTARARPHAACPDIRLLGTPLDRYSFPSGHTLHAVATLVVVTALLPTSAVVLLPLTLAIAASRVVLGLHWPSDVAAGALLGLAIGSAWSVF